MSPVRLHLVLVTAWTAIAIATFVVLVRRPAPYGRHARPGWGPRLPAALGWIVMEAPAPTVMAALYLAGSRHDDPAAAVVLVLWLAHYVYRALVFPFLGRGRRTPMPLAIAASGSVFNIVNAGLNGTWLFALGPERGSGWLADPRFTGGLALFVAGFAIHLRADAILRGLRGTEGSGYRVPTGFLFDRVSCPNYLGEIVQWCGFALLAWSPAAASFAVWTTANLVPRALAHHRWYRAQFPEYPRRRKALIPGLL